MTKCPLTISLAMSAFFPLKFFCLAHPCVCFGFQYCVLLHGCNVWQAWYWLHPIDAAAMSSNQIWQWLIIMLLFIIKFQIRMLCLLLRWSTCMCMDHTITPMVSVFCSLSLFLMIILVGLTSCHMICFSLNHVCHTTHTNRVKKQLSGAFLKTQRH